MSWHECERGARHFRSATTNCKTAQRNAAQRSAEQRRTITRGAGGVFEARRTACFATNGAPSIGEASGQKGRGFG